MALALSSCSSGTAGGPTIEHYKTAFRQTAPEPVYSRLTWSHLPEPMPTEGALNAPYLSPTVSFELPNSTLEEAVVALAQTIGYEPVYPVELASRKVSIDKVATIDEILADIEEQAGVFAEVNHQRRFLRFSDGSTQPKLPE